MIFVGDKECKLFFPRFMSVGIFFIQLACVTLRFMLYLIQRNTFFFIAKTLFCFSILKLLSD